MTSLKLLVLFALAAEALVIFVAALVWGVPS